MKKLISVLLVSMFVLSLTAQQKTDKVYLTKTVKIEKADMAELHGRAYSWLSTYFHDQHRKVTERFIDEDLVGANVEVTLKTLSDKLNFKVTITLSDNEYTYTIANVNQKGNNEILENYFANISKRIEKAMLKSTSEMRE